MTILLQDTCIYTFIHRYIFLYVAMCVYTITARKSVRANSIHLLFIIGIPINYYLHWNLLTSMYICMYKSACYIYIYRRLLTRVWLRGRNAMAIMGAVSLLYQGFLLLTQHTEGRQPPRYGVGIGGANRDVHVHVSSGCTDGAQIMWDALYTCSIHNKYCFDGITYWILLNRECIYQPCWLVFQEHNKHPHMNLIHFNLEMK